MKKVKREFDVLVNFFSRICTIFDLLLKLKRIGRTRGLADISTNLLFFVEIAGNYKSSMDHDGTCLLK